MSTVVEQGEMMMVMPGIPSLSVWHFNCSGKVTTLQEMGKESLTPDSLVPIILRRIEGGPDDRLCHIDNVTQDELVWERQRQPIANARAHHPAFCVWQRKKNEMTIQAGQHLHLMSADSTIRSFT